MTGVQTCALPISMNGGNLEDIALAAATSYAGSSIGAEVGSQVGGSEAVQALDKGTQITIKQVVTSASTNAATVALRGGSFDDILKAGAVGAVGSYVSSTLTKPTQLGGYGFDPKSLDTKLITTATAAATKAILNGKSIADAVVGATTVSALTLTISGNVDKMRSSDAAYKRVYDDFTALKDKASTYFDKNVQTA